MFYSPNTRFSTTSFNTESDANDSANIDLLAVKEINKENALADTGTMLALLQQWVDKKWLRALDLACARFLLDQAPEAEPLVLLTAALVSHQTGRGHVCLDLAQCLLRPNFVLSMPPEDLPELAEAVLMPDQILQGLTLEQWQITLQRNTLLVDTEGELNSAEAPLVLHLKQQTDLTNTSSKRKQRQSVRPLLYMRRYWQYEQEILRHLDRLLGIQVLLPEKQSRQILDLLFKAHKKEAPTETNWQKVACALAAQSAFAIITGGPGTGKTTTVINLLALLQAIALQQPESGSAKHSEQNTEQNQKHNQLPDQGLQIALAAPTGKAAARLNESLSGRIASLDLSGLELSPLASDHSAQFAERVREQIPTEVTTLHRLLGARPDSRHFRHHHHNPLTADVVVVDEASMIDVEMMARLMDALKPNARLILLGDKDQLASVEAGSVLGSLCDRADQGHYKDTTLGWLQQVTGEDIHTDYLDNKGKALDQAVAMLRKSYRFSGDSGIKHLADAVNKCESEQALRVLNTSGGDIEQLIIQTQEDKTFERLIRQGYGPYLEQVNNRPLSREQFINALTQGDMTDSQQQLDQWASNVLAQYGRFQLLTALRRGDWGIEGLNLRIRDILRKQLLGNRQGQNPKHEQIWYSGRPVLVTSNDYSLKLMNGDIGITLPVPVKQKDGSVKEMLRVAFPVGDGSGRIRWVLPSRLQAVETVFAMTVHKSQGSEFDHTVLVLPEHNSPVLSKELIYTGITRAKHKFTLVYKNTAVLKQGIEQRILRANGM